MAEFEEMVETMEIVDLDEQQVHNLIHQEHCQFHCQVDLEIVIHLLQIIMAFQLQDDLYIQTVLNEVLVATQQKIHHPQ